MVNILQWSNTMLSH